MMGLNPHDQAFFVGIRSTFYRISMVVGKGGLIALAGFLHQEFDVQWTWSLVFYGLTALFIGLALYHRFILPRPQEDADRERLSARRLLHDFGQTFVSFFQKEQALTTICFLLLFRLPEALIMPISQLFLQTPQAKGGLALTEIAFGTVNGIVGVAGLLSGGIIGGMMVSRDGLRRWLWPMTAAITLPNIAYVYLAYRLPSSVFAVGAAVFIENFGYGFGFSAYMLFMIYFSRGEPLCSLYGLHGSFDDDSRAVCRRIGRGGGLPMVLRYRDGGLRLSVPCRPPAAHRRRFREEIASSPPSVAKVKTGSLPA